MSERTPQDVLRELRQLAEEAKDERWYSASFFRAFIDDDDDEVFSQADARFMAAATPQVVLSLLDKAIAEAPDSPPEPFIRPEDWDQVADISDLRRVGPAAPDTLSEKPGLDAPEVVCLCGSTRFYEQFQQANYDLTMAGKIVLSVGFYPHSKAEHGHGEGVGHDSSEKVALDELHKRKIDLADRVLVLNVGGYVGQSTRGEIDYAIAHGKPVDYLEPLGSNEGDKEWFAQQLRELRDPSELMREWEARQPARGLSTREIARQGRRMSGSTDSEGR